MSKTLCDIGSLPLKYGTLEMGWDCMTLRGAYGIGIWKGISKVSDDFRKFR